MKQFNTLRLAVVVAAAAMALIGAGNASATELYSEGSTYGAEKTLDFSLEHGTNKVELDTELEPISTCANSTIKWKVTNAGSSTSTVTGEITALTWSECTFTTDTIQLGKFEIHHITGTNDGTLTSDSEVKWTINTAFFGSCVYGVKAGTDMGRITGGSPATIHLNMVVIELSSSFACPDTTLLTARYVATEPTGTLDVKAS